MSAVILVAEDDPFNLRLLQEVGQSSGYQVLTAATGGQVLDLVARQRPDVVLLDINIPIVDGFEVLRILKSDPKLADIPVLIVTALDDEGSKSKGIELGADDYVTKPYRIFEVQQRIKNALRIRNRLAETRKDSSSALEVSDAGTPQQLFISLNYEFTRSMRYGHSLTCAMVKIPDGVIVPFIPLIKSAIRSTDHIFYYQVDSVVVLLPETSSEGARVVEQRIFERFQAMPNELNLKEVPPIRLSMISYPENKVDSGLVLFQRALEKLIPK